MTEINEKERKVIAGSLIQNILPIRKIPDGRPQIRDFYIHDGPHPINIINDEIAKAPHLFEYARALEFYIDNINKKS